MQLFEDGNKKGAMISRLISKGFLGLLFSVISNRFHRASFLRLVAKGFFFRVFGLFLHVGIPAIIVSRKIRRSRFTAEVTINALVINVKFSWDVIPISVCNVSHTNSTSFPLYAVAQVKRQEVKLSYSSLSVPN
jgi:hypothetical protein